MAKSSSKTQFECTGCGRVTAKWVGKCVQCGEWNTVEEVRVAKATSTGRAGGRVTRRSGSSSDSTGASGDPVELNRISTDGTTYMPTGLEELDRVLGGGFVAGSTTLLAGDPGIGKSTLLLQAAAAIAETGRTVLYATGEEALEQIRIRASRLGVKGDRVFMAGTGDVLDIADHIASIEPSVVIVDSIQTANHPDLDSPAGTVSQIRECAAFLSDLARNAGSGRYLADEESSAQAATGHDEPMIDGEGLRAPEQLPTSQNFALMLSGHVTKDGNIAGPRVLEHQVDAVLQMAGDTGGMLRMLQGVKNRFGPTDEIGVFEMREEGLAGISDPSHVFIQQRAKAVSGSAVALVVEGTRSLAVEVQALATPSSLASPRRVANGVEMSRVHLITAVLAKHMRLPVSNHDLVISVTGGLDIREPAADLAIALAIASSMMDRPVDENVAVAGEIGLSGELRSIPRADRRATEAGRLGFATCMIPDAAGDAGKPGRVKIERPTNIAEAVRFALQPADAGANTGSGSATEVRTSM